jgi:hypothetical protein
MQLRPELPALAEYVRVGLIFITETARLSLSMVAPLSAASVSPCKIIVAFTTTSGQLPDGVIRPEPCGSRYPERHCGFY